MADHEAEELSSLKADIRRLLETGIEELKSHIGKDDFVEYDEGIKEQIEKYIRRVDELLPRQIDQAQNHRQLIKALNEEQEMLKDFQGLPGFESSPIKQSIKNFLKRIQIAILKIKDPQRAQRMEKDLNSQKTVFKHTQKIAKTLKESASIEKKPNQQKEQPKNKSGFKKT